MGLELESGQHHEPHLISSCSPASRTRKNVDQERYAEGGPQYACSRLYAESIANGAPVIPYQMPAQKESAGDISGTLGSTMPMAAMFTRNKYIGWYGDSTSAGDGQI
jgi:hypothetical protein